MLRSGEAKYSFVEEKEKGEETDKGTDGERPRLAATQACLNVRPDGDMVKNVSLYSVLLCSTPCEPQTMRLHGCEPSQRQSTYGAQSHTCSALWIRACPFRWT